MQQTIRAQVLDILGQYYGPSTVESFDKQAPMWSRDGAAPALGDSLEKIEVMMALETQFSIEISDSEAEPLFSVDQIVAFLENRLEKPQPAA